MVQERRTTATGVERRSRSAWLRRLPTAPSRAAIVVLALVTMGCSRTIEEDPPIPEHRFEPCESWCGMMFDPVCPAAEIQVPTEEECVEGCSEENGIWAPVDGVDECAATYVPYVDCLASLPCDELQQHFALTNIVPNEERSSCGGLLNAQLDCQTAHY